MCCRKSFQRILHCFVRKEDGSATIEAVIWIPFFLMLFGLLADVSMIFYNQSRLLRIVQDANRNMSVGRLTDSNATVEFVEAQGRAVSPHVTSTSSVTAGLITTTATVPMQDIDLFGVAGVFRNLNMTVRAEHLMES
ncbi:MAG TPA: TadE/TadG family type IV pilus assembly protein [Albidovulum sp.]|uniref:TadE/TadG family type IV pilus assembly protein n=1 Tax=Albidovulum sp. TaxID=1872424 RepID=UPI002B8A2874|nr:TadE/TadG family type IV pilus assembly protein [Albidovulum sp.]